MSGGIPTYRASTHCIPFGLQEVIILVTMIVSLKTPKEMDTRGIEERAIGITF